MFIIPDDEETLSNSIKPLKQESRAAAFNELVAILKAPAPGQMSRAIRVLGTPHIETSLYLELSSNGRFKIRYFPARSPDTGGCAHRDRCWCRRPEECRASRRRGRCRRRNRR
jgi:hypothetical protein